MPYLEPGMSYGHPNKAIAETVAAELRTRHPENRYEVEGHRWPAHHRTGDDVAPETRGVCCYVPYLEGNSFPSRCTGFIWHNYQMEGAK